MFAQGLRHVRAVEYIDSMGNVILDTLEVGCVPVAVLAAREDFEDSAGRLAFPSDAYDFLASELPDLGPVATCPMFSQMADFTTHEAAQVAALSATEVLFQAEEPEPATPESRRRLLGG